MAKRLKVSRQLRHKSKPMSTGENVHRYNSQDGDNEKESSPVCRLAMNTLIFNFIVTIVAHGVSPVVVIEGTK